MNSEELTKLHKRVFDTIDGKELLKYYEDKYYHKLSYSSVCKNDKDIYVNEGRRSIIIEIRKYVHKVLKKNK